MDEIDKKEPMTVKEIIKEYLEKNGYDGLYEEDCGCHLDDLFPCSNECCLDCEPGYEVELDDGSWGIGPKKKKQ